MARGLEAGFASIDITPEVNRQTIYHRVGDGTQDSVPVRDPIFAKAAAFRDGDCLAVWASLDICVLSTSLRRRIVAAFGRTGHSTARIMLSATHTHSAPTGHDFHGVEPMSPAYVEKLVERTVRAMSAAARDTRPAEAFFGRTRIDLSVNRREIGRMATVNDLAAPTGLVDRHVSVLKIRSREDGSEALLVNYAAHPLTMCREGGVISSDFPGRAMALLCAEGRVRHAQFLQGCAGNVNVKISGEGAAERAGGILAAGVREASDLARPSRTGDLRTACEAVQLPFSRVPTLDEARHVLAEVTASEPGCRPFWRRPWAEALLDRLEQGPPPTSVEVVVQALCVGDTVLVALPGEVFMEIGMEIRERAGIESLMVVAYANNGDIGYVPTRAAFGEGGMEVDTSPYYYGLFQLAPVSGHLLVEAGLRVIRRVCSGGRA